MKILMLVNWKIEYCKETPMDKQPSDYYIKHEDYWFYRYFKEKPEVDVVDVSSFSWLEKFEKDKLHFYIIQALRVIPKLHRYDLIVSHGMQSGIVVSLWRRFFRGKEKHIVFDIGSFASASESGLSLKMMQFASKSIEGIIYHTSSQITYYRKIFPWIVERSKFIPFGTDLDFFDSSQLKKSEEHGTYIICVGYSKRDWDTVIDAYRRINTKTELRLVGHTEEKYQNINGVKQIPFIPIRELINQIYNAKFCVLPLKEFNYSYGQMTLMQQMALGKCVLTARVSSLIDYIEEGKNALCYEAENITDLSSKMKMLIDEETLTKQIGQCAQRYLKEKCNEIIMAASIEDFFIKIMYSGDKD